MKKNAIILTSGLSGSSVLAGLIARAGYSTGGTTFKKADYDTHENQELVRLNEQLIAAARFDEDYTMVCRPKSIHRAAAVLESVDPAPYADFVARCDAHSPWVWKDPRLWITIRFWIKLLNVEQCRFVVLTRDPLQAWIGTTLRRQIQTYRYLRNYLNCINGSIVEFLQQYSLPYVSISYEDLVLDPSRAIGSLNAHLGTSLTLDDMTQTYTKPLYQLPRTRWDLAKAALIYMKYYSQRYR